MTSPLGDVFVTINEVAQHQPFEMFATLGKAGSIAMADVEAIGRAGTLSADEAGVAPRGWGGVGEE